VFLVYEGRALGDSLSWLERGGLALLLAGAVGAFAHGAGVAATSRLLRFVAVPSFAWPAILAGMAIMILVPVVA
jgi:hypothetical protein